MKQTPIDEYRKRMVKIQKKVNAMRGHGSLDQKPKGLRRFLPRFLR